MPAPRLEQVHPFVFDVACVRDPARVLLQVELPDDDSEVERGAPGGDRRAGEGVHGLGAAADGQREAAEGRVGLAAEEPGRAREAEGRGGVPQEEDRGGVL